MPEPLPPALLALRRWLAGWMGIGHIVTGMARQRSYVGLHLYADKPSPVAGRPGARALRITVEEARKTMNALRLTGDYDVVVGGRCAICHREAAAIEASDRAVRKPPTKLDDVGVDIQIMRPDELKAFLEVPLRRPRALIRDLFMETGLRPSSIAAANVGDVIEVDGARYLDVPVKSRGGGKRRRQCPLSAAIVESIKDYLLTRGMPSEIEPLLVRQDGARFSRTHLGEIIARIGRAAGITRFRVGPRSIRHLVNTLSRVGGADPYQRSRLLGHVNTATVVKYDHLIPGELHDARSKQREGLRRYLGDQ